jgi:hypothetical protein
MAKEKLPAIAALLLFATAWFLPVEAEGAQLSDGVIPGVQAFLVAIGPVTQYHFSELDLITIRELLTAMSALSNLLMVYSLAVVLGWPRSHFPAPRRLATMHLVALIINAQWIWPRGGEFLQLRAGYWLWVTSFALVALAVRRLERRKAHPGEAPTPDRRGAQDLATHAFARYPTPR